MVGKGQSIIQILEKLAPKHIAIQDDRIGLQVGTLNKEVKKVMLTLDVLEEVVDEAVENEVDLIIAHHAVIFKPLKNLRTDLPQGRIYEKLIKHNIAVYIAHTNLDSAEGGVNDVLANKLPLKNVDILEKVHTQKLKKLVVFVPESHQQDVLDALAAAGAGWIGNYSHCSFQISGTGTFMPQEGTNPYIGDQNKLEKVKEVRIETIIPEEQQRKAIQAMIKAHPYEEVAYDIYPLEIEGKEHGIGRIGQLKETINLEHLAQLVKESYQLEGLRVVGPLDKEIKKVAIIGGDGNNFVMKAAFKGADALITGDIYYHVAHEAMAQGLAIIDAGHNIEKLALESVSQYLKDAFTEKKISTEVILSQTNTNPFKFL